MSYENYKGGGFDRAKFLSLFDGIPDWRQGSIDKATNKAGISSEILRNNVEDFFTNNPEDSEDPEKLAERAAKITRIGEILTVISEGTKYGDDVESNLIPEKIEELMALVK